MAPQIPLTGPPGCGKTTVIVRTLERLTSSRHLILILLLVLGHAVVEAVTAAETAAERPNIVVILADDLGYGDPFQLSAPADPGRSCHRQRAQLLLDDRRQAAAGVGFLSERFVLRRHVARDGKTMIRRILGRTGLEVTQLGYGSMGLRGPRTWGVRVVSEEDADRFLNSVLDAGINFVDTSPDYGISEERIGRYIGSRRNEFYLATKCGCVYT